MAKRYLEYDRATGRIIDEVFVPDGQEATEGLYGLFEISSQLAVDFNSYIVRDGELIRAAETPEDRLERERRRAEAMVRRAKRIKEVLLEFLQAQLEDDTTRQAILKAEYRTLKSRL